jgi:membrane protease YdiL (CAAX protease family)
VELATERRFLRAFCCARTLTPRVSSWARDTAPAAIPIALLIVAALLRETRPIALVALAVGVAIAIRRDLRDRWSWSAALPIGVALCWGLLPTPIADLAGADCTNPASPPAVWRAGEAAVVLASVATLAWTLRASISSLGLQRPSLPVVWLSVVGFVLFGPLALVLGATLAGPFFGTFSLDLGQPAAVVPALLFAVSNGVMEEITYRGAFTSWFARVSGLPTAVVVQAVLFGVAHGGPDFVGSPLPVMAAMFAGALIAAVLAIRTRSLLLPIAIHVALDLPIYYYFACRAG